MLKLNVNNETSRLLVIVLGTAKSNGITPKIDDCYDPTSRQNVLNQTYPSEYDMIDEMNQFKQVLYKYDIEIIRPSIINDYNQVLAVGIQKDGVYVFNHLPEDKNYHYS